MTTIRVALLFGSLLLPHVALADEPVTRSVSGEGAFDERAGEHRVKATLHLSPDEREPRLGVLLEPDEGWHVYWKNSGNAGLPTRITWSIDHGMASWTGEAMTWPMPHVFIEGGGFITTYGYDTVLHEALIPERVWQAARESGEEVRLRASLDYLTCEVECIPGQHSLALTLPAGELFEPRISTTMERFEDAAKIVPTEAALDPRVEVTSLLSQDRLRVGDEGVWRVRVKLCQGDHAPSCEGSRFAPYDDPTLLLLPELAHGVRLEVANAKVNDARDEAMFDVAWRVVAGTASPAKPVEFAAVFEVHEGDEITRALRVTKRLEGGIKARGSEIERATLPGLGEGEGAAADKIVA